MKPFALFLFSALGLAAHAGASEAESAAQSAGDSPLSLDAATQQQLGIDTVEVKAQVESAQIKAPGEVKANAYATALVSPRVAAQVVRRTARLGDVVKAGQPLVTLSSVEVAQAQGALIVAEREWQRVKALGADAVSARRYTEAQVARDQAHATLRAFGLADGDIRALLKNGSSRANGEFSLLAPQTGRVTSDDFVVGERVEPGKPLFTLVDESSVWVEAQLPPANIADIAADAPVRIVAHGQSIDGKVVQRAHRNQESTRTSPVRIEVRNDKDLLHPGEFVEAFVTASGSEPALSVPSTAIVQLQGQTIVFKAVAADRFEAAPVEVRETRGDSTRISQGLSEGDRVVARGAYVLKARLLKSQLGEE